MDGSSRVAAGVFDHRARPGDGREEFVGAAGNTTSGPRPGDGTTAAQRQFPICDARNRLVEVWRDDPLLSGNLEASDEVADWAAWLAEEDDSASLARLLIRTGRPAGDDTFVDRLESLLGGILRPRRPGRPRKSQ